MLLDLIRLARPTQWLKNGIMVLALVFAGELSHPEKIGLTIIAIAVFCALSSAVYTFNDLIDTERDRLYASGFWGVEVIDLETGRTLFRERLGMISRKATIDEAHGLIYVPTTGEGKLHVFDRDTFERLGQIPIGYGPRYPHVTRAGAWLLATNAWAHYAFDASEIARRLRE